MAPRLVAVTGGTGFLGRHIVRALAAEGWRVRVLARRDPSDPLWRDVRPEVVLGDLAGADDLARLVEGADAVVHAAGLIKARSAAAFHAVNVTGAARVAAATRAHAPGANFVLVSSLAAREPHLSDYAHSKRAGEEAVQAVFGGRAQVVRPCAVYGPGDRETLALFRAAATSPVLPLLDPRARISLVHAADAALAVAALAVRPVGGIVALSDGRADGYGWREIMTTAAAAVATRPKLARVPAMALKVLGLWGDLGGRLGATPMLASGKVRELLHADWRVRREEQAAGVPAPTLDLASGFAQTVDWYRQVGWLAPRPSNVVTELWLRADGVV